MIFVSVKFYCWCNIVFEFVLKFWGVFIVLGVDFYKIKNCLLDVCVFFDIWFVKVCKGLNWFLGISVFFLWIVWVL